MKVLVLGASGFIGSNIVDALVSREGHFDALVHRNAMPGQRGVKWRTRAELEDTRTESYDAILCLAGVGNPAGFETGEWVNAEHEIVQLVHRFAVRSRSPRIVYLSSAGTVYGEGWSTPTPRVWREDDPCNPISAYGRAKLECEQRLQDALAASGLASSLVVFRVTNAYGPRYAKAGQQGLINALLQRAETGEAITIFGDGNVYRDFLYTDDLANAVTAALHSREHGIFNIGSGTSHSIIEVVAALENALGRQVTRKHVGARSFDVRHSAVSVERATRDLGWRPLVDLRTGIAQLLRARLGDHT